MLGFYIVLTAFC